MTKITIHENLLVTAMEECAELQQAISKVLRFGKNNYHPSNPCESNNYAVINEYNHIVAMMKKLIQENVLDDIPMETAEVIRKTKIVAVERYIGVSVQEGKVQISQ